MKRLAIAVLSIMSVLMLFSCDGNVSNPGTGPEEPTFIKPTEPAEVPEYDPSMGGEELSGAALDAFEAAVKYLSYSDTFIDNKLAANETPATGTVFDGAFKFEYSDNWPDNYQKVEQVNDYVHSYNGYELVISNGVFDFYYEAYGYSFDFIYQDANYKCYYEDGIVVTDEDGTTLADNDLIGACANFASGLSSAINTYRENAFLEKVVPGAEFEPLKGQSVVIKEYSKIGSLRQLLRAFKNSNFIGIGSEPYKFSSNGILTTYSNYDAYHYEYYGPINLVSTIDQSTYDIVLNIDVTNTGNSTFEATPGSYVSINGSVYDITGYDNWADILNW